MNEKREHHFAQKQRILSAGAVLTNSLLLAAVVYTMSLRTLHIVTSFHSVLTIRRTSVAIVLMTVLMGSILFYGVRSGIRSIRASFSGQPQADTIMASNCLVSSITALAFMGLFAGKAGVAPFVTTAVLILAALSCLAAYFGYTAQGQRTQTVTR